LEAGVGIWFWEFLRAVQSPPQRASKIERFGLAKTGLCHMVNLRKRKHP
jgi:hypothetical protein